MLSDNTKRVINVEIKGVEKSVFDLDTRIKEKQKELDDLLSKKNHLQKVVDELTNDRDLSVESADTIKK